MGASFVINKELDWMWKTWVVRCESIHLATLSFALGQEISSTVFGFMALHVDRELIYFLVGEAIDEAVNVGCCSAIVLSQPALMSPVKCIQPWRTPQDMLPHPDVKSLSWPSGCDVFCCSISQPAWISTGFDRVYRTKADDWKYELKGKMWNDGCIKVTVKCWTCSYHSQLWWASCFILTPMWLKLSRMHVQKKTFELKSMLCHWILLWELLEVPNISIDAFKEM